MTDAQRAQALARLTEQIAALMTTDEQRLYPAIEHLTDLIDDLDRD